MKLKILAIVLSLCFVQSTLASPLDNSHSYSENISSPVRICTDDIGNIYLTDSFRQQACRMDSLGNISLRIPGIHIPMAIAVDRNYNILVSDRSDSSVKIFDSNGDFIRKLGAADEAITATDIEFDSEGQIYVVDNAAHCVKVYTSQWELSRTIGETELHYPVSIAVNNGDDEIIVGQDFMDTDGQIVVFNKNGELLRQFAAFGHGRGKFTRVQGMTVDSNQRLYICDAFQNVVQIVDGDGNFIDSLSVFGPNARSLKVPLDVTILAGQYLLTTSYNSSEIAVFPLQGGSKNEQLFSDVQHDSTATEQFTLYQNFPNPCNPSTWIPYQLHESSQVTVSIFNILGKRVRHYDLGYQTAGNYTSSSQALFWDGKDELGFEVPSGIYFYRIRANSHISYKKLIIMK